MRRGKRLLYGELRLLISEPANYGWLLLVGVNPSDAVQAVKKIDR